MDISWSVLVGLQVAVLGLAGWVAVQLAAVRREQARVGRLQAQQQETLSEQQKRLGQTVAAARAETRYVLESLVAGVQGLARNLDAERRTSMEALQNLERLQQALKESLQVEPEVQQRPPQEVPCDTLQDVAPVLSIGELRRKELLHLAALHRGRG